MEAGKAQLCTRWQTLREEIAEKKAALAIDGRPPEQRADEFAPLNDKLLSARRAEAEQREIIPEQKGQTATEYNAEAEALAAIALMEMLALEMEMDGLSGPEAQKDAVVSRNEAINGIEVRFSAHPPHSLTVFLKGRGFRWSGRQSLWYAKYSEALLSEVSDRLIAEGYAVAGDGSNENPEVVRAAKERIAARAEEQQQAKITKYLREYPTEHRFALLPYNDFAEAYRANDNSDKPRVSCGGIALKWDEAKGDFTHLPTGRKRPDRYELPQVKRMLMQDAMMHGVTIPLETYFGTPGLSLSAHPELQLSDIKMLVSRYPQQAFASDYHSTIEDLERAISLHRSIRERWAKYRSKVIAPLAERAQKFWTKEKGKGKAVIWTQWHCQEKLEELARPTDRGTGDTLALERGAGYIIFQAQYPFHAIYLEREATQSIIELYPIKDVLEKGLVPHHSSGTASGDEEATVALALMEMLALEMSL